MKKEYYDCNHRIVATTGKNKAGKPTYKCIKCGRRWNKKPYKLSGYMAY